MTDGLLPARFGGGNREMVRQQRNALAALHRTVELTQEAIAQLNHTEQVALQEVFQTAMFRNQCIQFDPAGAEVYAAMWVRTAHSTQALVDDLARHLR